MEILFNDNRERLGHNFVLETSGCNRGYLKIERQISIAEDYRQKEYQAIVSHNLSFYHTRIIYTHHPCRVMLPLLPQEITSLSRFFSITRKTKVHYYYIGYI